MKKNKTKSKIVFFILFYLLPFTFLLSSCVRLTGNAGVWKQGPEDEEPVSHEVGFDTQDLVPQASGTRQASAS